MNLARLLKRPQDIPKAITPFFRPYELRTTAHIANSRCVISDNKRFLYFRIPKAANSTIIATLYQLEHGHTSPQDGIKMKSSYRHPDTLSAREASEVRDSYFKFTVVRNPYDRFLSAYLEKIVGGKLRQKQKVTKRLGVSADSEISIDLFLDYLEGYNGTLADAHWAIQTDMIFMPLSELDYVGKVETLSEDLPNIVSRIFGVDDFQMAQRAKHATGATSKRTKMLNGDQLRRIRKIYQQDFDLLGYSAD